MFLHNEPTWLRDDALDLVDWLCAQAYAVLGIELWEEWKGDPRWVLSSDYRYDEIKDWAEYVKLCAESARRFIDEYGEVPGLLFNLSWISHDGLRELRKNDQAHPPLEAK